MTSTPAHAALWDGYLKKDISFLSCPHVKRSFFRWLYEDGWLLARDLQGCHVLEIGCGDGADAVKLIQNVRCSRLTAINVSSKRLELATRVIGQSGLADRITAVQRDAHDTGFPDHQFDAVVCNSVMLFLDHDRFFREARRILKPLGRVYFFNESMPHSLPAILARIIRLSPRTAELEKNITCRLSDLEIARLCASHGLKCVYRASFLVLHDVVMGDRAAGMAPEEPDGRVGRLYETGPRFPVGNCRSGPAPYGSLRLLPQSRLDLRRLLPIGGG